MTDAPKPLSTGLMERLQSDCYPESEWREVYEAARFTVEALASAQAEVERLKTFLQHYPQPAALDAEVERRFTEEEFEWACMQVARRQSATSNVMNDLKDDIKRRREARK